jgi:hypothetical protein
MGKHKMIDLASDGLYMLGLLGTVTGTLICWVLLVYQRRSIMAIQQQHKEISSFHTSQISALNKQCNMQNKQLVNLQNRLKQAIDRQYELSNQTPNKPDKAEVIKLINMGASIDELVSNCGIARGEAELMVAMGQGLQKTG